MKTEALIGKELGTSRLQRLIGRGTLARLHWNLPSSPNFLNVSSVKLMQPLPWNTQIFFPSMNMVSMMDWHTWSCRT